MNEFIVYPPNTKVHLIDMDSPARIITIALSGGMQGVINVRYEVAWMGKTDRRTAWVGGDEFTAKNGEKIQIGFTNEQSSR